MKYLVAFAFIFAVSLGCQSCAHTTPTPTNTDAGTTPSCATACANGARMNCMWASPTPMGHTCVEVCTNAEQSVPWDVAGLTTVTTCQ
ncbi:MAG: hypothetical protein ACLQIJ_13575 [Polyangia bacterium]